MPFSTSRAHTHRGIQVRPSNVASVMRSIAILLAAAFIACSPSRASEARPDTVTLPTPRPEVRFLALGDSFTIGTGSMPEQSFPARLAARWQTQGRTVTLRNLGVNGYTAQNLIDRELPEIRSFGPTVVTLAVGANDIVRGSEAVTYRMQVHRILAAVIANGVIASQIVAIPQPDWSLSPAASSFGEPDAIRARIVEFNDILRDETVNVGSRYVDLFPLMRRQAEAHMIARDGLHPSSDAYDQWADALDHEITSSVTRAYRRRPAAALAWRSRQRAALTIESIALEHPLSRGAAMQAVSHVDQSGRRFECAPRRLRRRDERTEQRRRGDVRERERIARSEERRVGKEC